MFFDFFPYCMTVFCTYVLVPIVRSEWHNKSDSYPYPQGKNCSKDWEVDLLIVFLRQAYWGGSCRTAGHQVGVWGDSRRYPAGPGPGQQVQEAPVLIQVCLLVRFC